MQKADQYDDAFPGFLDHLTNDAMSALIERLAAATNQNDGQ